MQDLISRAEAIDALTEYGNGRAVFISVGEAVIRIENLPPAEPKRIRGKWITDKQGYVTWSAICNKCGARTEMLDGYYNFCPNCGADMRGEQDG